ncbi:MAG: GDSL-type esterase/lipase family protein [Candidatus Limnocylindrales bacterium]
MSAEAAGRSLRVCIVGDSIVSGTGDDAALGWTGRVAAAALGGGADLTLYSLGVRGDTSREVAARWRAEVGARLPATFPRALVFAYGLNDCAVRTWDDGRQERRVPQAETEGITRTLLRDAGAVGPVGFVGPAPVDDERDGPQLVPGVRQRVSNDEVEAMDRRLAAIASELDVPYLAVFSTLRHEARWQAALRAGDGVHPTAIGYAALAELVGEWSFWTALRSITTGGQG